MKEKEAVAKEIESNKKALENNNKKMPNNVRKSAAILLVRSHLHSSIRIVQSSFHVHLFLQRPNFKERRMMA